MMWIPLRSMKMKRFIFGFHRRAWCPKWTPDSKSCFMVTTANAFSLDASAPRLTSHPGGATQGSREACEVSRRFGATQTKCNKTGHKKARAEGPGPFPYGKDRKSTRLN